jgi:hypothetical protein
VASVIVNSADTIQFVNVSGKDVKKDPTLIVQGGDWDTGDSVETGITFDVFGSQTPILTTANARKLAQWLTKTADLLDGVKHTKKKHPKPRYEDDDTDDFLSQY